MRASAIAKAMGIGVYRVLEPPAGC
jgi:hypothetical protein